MNCKLNRIMKTIDKGKGVCDFIGCTKTISVDGVKIKLVFDMLNFSRNNSDFISEYDVAIGGKTLGHVCVPFSDRFVFNGIEFPSEKRMMEYVVKL